MFLPIAFEVLRAKRRRSSGSIRGAIAFDASAILLNGWVKEEISRGPALQMAPMIRRARPPTLYSDAKREQPPQGIFRTWRLIAVRDALPSYLKGMVTFAHKTGWRKKEVTDLQWTEVDVERGIVRLNPGETKNDEGRTVYLDVELKEISRAQWTQRIRQAALCPYLFPNEKGTDKFQSFRGSWDAACATANTSKCLFQDPRRTAVQNMVRAGIPGRVAMMISGHRTRSIFDRYNIVSETDLALAATKQEASLNSVMGTKTGTIIKMKKRAKPAN